MAENLAGRVRSARQQKGGDGPPNGGADVARREPDEKALIAAVRSMQDEYARAMGPVRGPAAAQLVRDVVTAVRTTPKLAICNQASVLGGAMTFAQLGLRMGVLGHGWLIPMWSEKRKEQMATVIIGYRGYVKLAYNATALRDVRARTIYGGDDWDVEYGSTERIMHRPALTDRGAPIGYYCVVNMQSGGQVFHFRSLDEMEHHRDRFAMSREFDWTSGRPKPKFYPEEHPLAGRPVITGPWRDDFEAMAHKTEWLSVSRWVPMSTDLELATFADGTARLDMHPGNKDAMAEGERLGDTIVDGDVVDTAVVEEEPAEREQVTVVGRGDPPADTAAEQTTAEDTADTAEEGEPPEQRRGEPPADPDRPLNRQQLIKSLFAAMKPCGVTDDVTVMVLTCALNGWALDDDDAKVPGSFDDIPSGQLARALGMLNEWRGDGDDAQMCSLLLEHRPDPEHPVWARVEAARKAHEDAKRPSTRRARKGAEKEEGTDG